MDFFDKLLNFYNINKEQYLYLTREINENDIPHYSIFKNIDIVKEKIFDAIKNKKKILIYGDYDADGILATSILVKSFKLLNYDVLYYIPSRYLDGYGISIDKIKEAKENNVSLIITVDNGVTMHESIKFAKENGIEIIVTDHHDYKEEPQTLFLHPNLSNLKASCSGATIAFYLSYALLNKINPYLLTLSMVSTISDVMILKDNNRDLVKLGLKYLNLYKFDQFKILSGIETFDEQILSSKIIPKINAVGRIEKDKEVNILVKYFVSEDYSTLLKINEYLEGVNLRRRDISNTVINSLPKFYENAIVSSLEVLSGLTGLIANRLLDIYNKPTAIFSTITDDDKIRGSIRSKNGFNCIDFISNNKTLFIESGGHECACGIVIKKNDISLFKEKFLEFSNLNPFKKSSDNIEISFNDINLENYKLIKSFSPFGNLWKEPSFIIKNVDVNLIKRVGSSKNHLSINLEHFNKIIGFNFNFDSLNNKTSIDLIGKFRLNEYKNHLSLNFILEN